MVKAKAKANAAKVGNAKKGGAPVGKGLKISFKPSELSRTTERNVASQVRFRLLLGVSDIDCTCVHVCYAYSVYTLELYNNNMALSYVQILGALSKDPNFKKGGGAGGGGKKAPIATANVSAIILSCRYVLKIEWI